MILASGYYHEIIFKNCTFFLSYCKYLGGVLYKSLLFCTNPSGFKSELHYLTEETLFPFGLFPSK